MWQYHVTHCFIKYYKCNQSNFNILKFFLKLKSELCFPVLCQIHCFLNHSSFCSSFNVAWEIQKSAIKWIICSITLSCEFLWPWHKFIKSLSQKKLLTFYLNDFLNRSQSLVMITYNYLGIFNLKEYLQSKLFHFLQLLAVYFFAIWFNKKGFPTSNHIYNPVRGGEGVKGQGINP